MPGLKPDIANAANVTRKKQNTRVKKWGLKAGLAISGLPISFSHALAQEASTLTFKQRFIESFHSTEILMLAIFGGAMSFALMSASWLIRERNRIAGENSQLKNSLSILRADHDRNEALVNVKDQAIVVWNGVDAAPKMLGELTHEEGTPKNSKEFMEFDDWLSGNSAAAYKALLTDLRVNAVSFDTTIKTKNGDVLEAQGRISGSYAFTRIREIGSEREEYAKIKNDYDDLVGQYSIVESLFDSLPIPVWLRNSSGKLEWVNNAYANALELSEPEKAIGTDWDLFDQEHREIIHNSAEEQSAYKGTLPATVAGDRKKLEVYSIQGNSGFAGIALDKSDVDDVTRRLKETNEGHAKMLDQLATAVATFDRSQKLVFHNSSFRQLWKLEESFLESGPSNAELLDAMREGKLLPDHPDWRKWRDSQLDIYQAIEPNEEWWHLLDGQTIRVVMNPRNEGGSTWIFENVTERLALESNYNSLIQVQGETLDHLTEAVAVFGSNGKLRLYNPTLETLWNASGMEVDEGLHIVKIIEAWTASIANPEALQQILGKITGLDDTRSDLEGRLTLQNGCSYEYRLVPLPDGQSMLTLSDVTANVNIEKALNERAEALEASDLLKSKFIQHVSYELRAPLTNIAGFGEMLSTPEIGAMNEKQAEYLSHINTSADELRAIVDDILDLASIDAGSMTLDFEQFDLRRNVAGIFADFEAICQEKDIRTHVEIDKDIELITADPMRITQILSNLVSNAINFSPNGGMVKISAMRNGDMNEIRVMDEGPGISEDMRDIIFDRFETRAQEGARKGTGLGLSIVKSFLELHGGSVSIEEAGQTGICFVCKLPVEPKLQDPPIGVERQHSFAA
jgi:signal transduction histidine kinase